MIVTRTVRRVATALALATAGALCAPGIASAADFDADGRTDFAIWRPSSGTWRVIRSSNGGELARQWGESADIPVPGDYDGDGRTDFAIWRPSSGTWRVIRSSNGSDLARQWGESADIPISG
ncbi:MAG TPA: VCBS repeat-containing protein [Solirubrobacteraceae bacterium]|nr:VCBS repeat-containing protein [Solirubrobacteraceae bacterium]